MNRKSKKGQGGGPFEALRPLKDELAKKAEGAKPLPHKRAEAPAPPVASRAAAPAEDEAMLFHRLFAGVAPLGRAPGRIPREPIERSPKVEGMARHGAADVRADAAAVHEHLRSLVEGRARFEVSDDGQRVEGRRVDLPVEALRQLRRGRLPIDARIDLHGLTVAEAKARLDSFLRNMRARGERCVLVIHGKGEHSPGGAGVLRGEISAWLGQGASSENVAAFASAQTGDGGEGAVYVLLRR